MVIINHCRTNFWSTLVWYGTTWQEIETRFSNSKAVIP